MDIFELRNNKKKNEKKEPEINIEIKNDLPKEKQPTVYIGDEVKTVEEHEETKSIETSSSSIGENKFTIVEEEETTLEVPVEIETTLEEETNEDELELKVIKSIERVIKTDLYELENIKFKLEVLNNAQDEEIDTKEVEKLKDELEYLLGIFEEIKKKYNNIPFDSNSELQINDDEIYTLVNEYKASLAEKQDDNLISQINSEIKEIEEYVSVIETLLYVEKETDTLEETIDEKCEKFGIRDEEFDKLQKEYANIEAINENIEDFTKRQDNIIKDLNYKIEHSENISRRIETQSEIVTNFSKLIEAALMYQMAKKIPSTPAGMILKTGLMIGAATAITELVQVKEKQKEVIEVSYTDYVKDIQNNIANVDSMISSIDKAKSDIEAISYTFKKECEEYASLIPEYDKLLKNIDSMSKTLTEQKDIAKKHKTEFDKVLEKNNQKVKKLEELKTS